MEFTPIQERELSFKKLIRQGIPAELPVLVPLNPECAHAPVRNIKGILSLKEKVLAVKNALRYFDEKWHPVLANEFAQELDKYGRIYMYRFRPHYAMHARSIEDYPAKSRQAAAIMLMIQNNLDPNVAKYPEELITYGGNGAVFQNWAQYLLTMSLLSEMSNEQTLVLYSGHPLGLFPSHKNAPRVVVTNGMMIPNYSSKNDWNKYNALGVTQYGQMTAGSFMYIGPQGIVHGTTITLLNAGRQHNLGNDNLRGRLFISSGLGGMSGAQALAGMITEAVTILAEVDPGAIKQRMNDGYIQQENVFDDLKLLLDRTQKATRNKEVITLVYYGNIVELLEACVAENIHVDLGSDQTSLHNIDDMGYCPVDYTFEEASALMLNDNEAFHLAIKNSLKRHVEAVNMLSERGMYFWDYGNAFLKEAGEANADIWKNEEEKIYKYSSYVEDIMGPLCFDYGFGPFRWVCCSGLIEDLQLTDKLALQVMEELKLEAAHEIQGQLQDNIKWIENAGQNIPVVGSKSRILYADAWGRIAIAKVFNKAIRHGMLKGPVVLGRDHHDVSGTDSPFRETANIYDGSKFTADMATHNVIGDSFRGATWVSIHNGGGVGWGEVVNGGFGMVLDGTDQAEQNLESMLFWDVNNGIARRSWARNPNAMHTIKKAMDENTSLRVTMPNLVDDQILEDLF